MSEPELELAESLGVAVRAVIHSEAARRDEEAAELRLELAKARDKAAELGATIEQLNAQVLQRRATDTKSHERMMNSLDAVQRASDLEREIIERQHAERKLRAELAAVQASAAALDEEKRQLDALAASKKHAADGLSKKCAQLQQDNAKLQTLLEQSMLSRGGAAAPSRAADANESELGFVKRAATRQKIALQRANTTIADLRREIEALQQQQEQQRRAPKQRTGKGRLTAARSLRR